MAKTNLTAQRLRELLHYDPETGVFTRLVKTCNSVRIGAVAGCIDAQGYRVISIGGDVYKGHRLAWLYVFGEWPFGEIDHISGHRDDNRIANIRDVSSTVNSQNRRRAHPSSSTGLLGVEKNSGKWIARIVVNGERIYIGRFETPEQAHAAYINAKRELHEGCTI